MANEDAAKTHNIFFTIARMNPPTSGHMGLIRHLMAEAKAAGEHTVYILLQAGDKAGGEKMNPLFCAEKKEYLELMIQNNRMDQEGLEIKIICADDEKITKTNCDTIPNIILKHICYMCTLEKVKEIDDVNLNLFIGEDRVADFKKFLGTGEPGTKSYLPPKQKTFYHNIPRPEGAISATKVRAMAFSDDPSAFIQEETAAGLKPEQAMELYTLLHARMIELPDVYKKTTGAKRKSVATAAESNKRGKTTTANTGGRKSRRTKGKKKSIRRRSIKQRSIRQRSIRQRSIKQRSIRQRSKKKYN
jgi:hypothetical protein